MQVNAKIMRGQLASYLDVYFWWRSNSITFGSKFGMQLTSLSFLKVLTMMVVAVHHVMPISSFVRFFLKAVGLPQSHCYCVAVWIIHLALCQYYMFKALSLITGSFVLSRNSLPHHGHNGVADFSWANIVVFTSV